MALDPSIPLQAGQAVQPTNGLDIAVKAQGLKNAQTTGRILNTQAETADQGLNATRQKAIAGIALTALSFDDPKQMVDALHSSIDRAVQAGVIPQQQAQQWFAGIGQSRDPAHLREMVRMTALNVLDPNAALTRIYGAPATVSNGQDVQPGVMADPFKGGGFQAAGAGIPQYPSRSELAGRVTGPVDPATGAPTQVPLQAVTPPNLAGPAAATIPNGGRLPPALRNTQNAPPAPTGTVATGLGPAEQAAKSQTGTQSAAAFQKYSEEGAAATQQDAILGNMLTEVEQFGTGIGQDKVKTVRQIINRLPEGWMMAFGVDPSKLAANESFDKLAAQIANAQGAGSDARLAVTQNANPNSSLSPEGIRMIINQLRGNTDYLKARQQLAAAYPNKADREGFEASIASKLDPRAFQYARLSPEQRHTYFANIKDAKDREAFKNAYVWAEERGLLNGGR